MEITDAMIDNILIDIREALDACRNEDGRYRITGDNRRYAIAALDFAKLQVTKAIMNEQNQ